MINKFRGRYSFLSNFYTIDVPYCGIIYPSSEHAYQASKTFSEEIKNDFLSLSASEAKRFGSIIEVRKDWKDVRVHIMHDIVYSKFFHNKRIRQLLLRTASTPIVEGNLWHDNFWGDCYCKRCKDKIGHNNLGITLMKVRLKLKDDFGEL